MYDVCAEALLFWRSNDEIREMIFFGEESNIFLFISALLIKAHIMCVRWAGRSVVDRVLGMDEAAGSISARSTCFFLFYRLPIGAGLVEQIFDL